MARLTLSGGELDGLTLAYEVAGRGPVTLLIHGLGGFAASWRHTMAALSRHGTVVALDLPGFGESAKPRRRYGLGFLAAAVDGLLRALDVDRVRLVGHSLGGGVAVAHALAWPARVERLALVSAVVPGFPLRPALAYRLMALPGLGELIGRLITPALCAAALDRCFFAANPGEVAFLAGHQSRVRASADGRAAYLAALRGARRDLRDNALAYRAGFAQWHRPVLLIHGRQDRVVPVGHAEAVAQGLSRVEMRLVDRCGHFPQIEHVDLVNEWLGEFLFAGAAGR